MHRSTDQEFMPYFSFLHMYLHWLWAGSPNELCPAMTEES